MPPDFSTSEFTSYFDPGSTLVESRFHHSQPGSRFLGQPFPPGSWFLGQPFSPWFQVPGSTLSTWFQVPGSTLFPLVPGSWVNLPPGSQFLGQPFSPWFPVPGSTFPLVPGSWVNPCPLVPGSWVKPSTWFPVPEPPWRHLFAPEVSQDKGFLLLKGRFPFQNVTQTFHKMKTKVVREGSAWVNSHWMRHASHDAFLRVSFR